MIRQPLKSTLTANLTALCLGLLLALCGLPLPWSALSVLPLAGLLWWAAQAGTPRQLAGRMFWSGLGYNALHLWWLTAFLSKLFGVPPLGVLAFALFALQASFLAGLAWLVGRGLRSPQARLWGLAGGWVLLEWLRFLGPPAFPWPTLGYILLPTPLIQVADLGGVLLGSVLVASLAAALAHGALVGWGRAARPLSVMALVWVAALGYGLTRTPGDGEAVPMLVQRTTIDSFGRASRQLSAEEQFELQARLTRDALRPGETIVWSEGSIYDPALLPEVPGPGIYGVGVFEPRRNAVMAWDGRAVVAESDKARPVPFGEYFPFREALAPAWAVIERAIGIPLNSVPPAERLSVLTLNGVRYGAYVCYDSVFSWVSRVLVRQGAEVLVNVSNDGWYDGWGVQQHFMMGRVRAIETRRYVVRSVNQGIAAEIDDLGRPVQTLSAGQNVLHVAPKRLTGQTLFVRLGDWPALLLALLLIGYGAVLNRRTDRASAP